MGLEGCMSGGILNMLVLFAPMFLILYLLIWRPEQAKRKKHQNMLGNLAKGHEVVTTGGLHGTVVGVQDDIVVLRIGKDTENITVEVMKSAITFVKRGGELIEGE